MSDKSCCSCSPLFPVVLLSFVVALFLGFQTYVLATDRGLLQEAKTQQTSPLEQTDKVKAQVNALAVGTLKLSREGNKDAIAIIEQLKRAGINVNDQPQNAVAPAAAAAAAPVPAGMPAAPVKP